MHRSVASFFLFVFLLPAIAYSQTRDQGTKRRVRGTSPRQNLQKSTSGTLKICQGVAVPDGYVIVGYVTSSACPHGAYVIKKQESGLKLSDVPAQDPQQPVASTTASPVTSAIGSPVSSAAVSRPRRVSLSPSNAGIPSLRNESDSSGPSTAGNPASTPLEPTSVEEVEEGDVVRVDTTLVTVPVSVTDRQGRFVPNLRKEDFVVLENGVEQPIAYFEPTEKPFTVALLLDTSASTRFHLWEIKEAAIAFAKQLRPQDRVLVVTFSDQVLLLTEVTNDFNVISTVIQANALGGNSTRLYDAVDLVIRERLDKIPGRKAIVLFTDGVDTSSYLATYDTTLREAEELDALIYPIQYDTTDYMRAMQGGGSVTVVTSTSNGPFGSSSSRVTYGVPSTSAPLPGATRADYDRADVYLRELAERTGARLFRANDRTQLSQAFTRISEELRRQYSLGYYPQKTTDQSGERRFIKVRVRQPNLAVRARNSYMRPTLNK